MGCKLMKEYYKKIDKSFFKYGITIPKDRVGDFLCDKPLLPGESRKINIKWKKNTYFAHLYHVNRKKGTVHQVRWDNDKEFISELKQEFIQSYFAIESQNFEAKEENKYYVTNLLGGNQEVVIFKIIDINTIELETFIKIQTNYDNVFKKLVEQNVFGWLSNKKHKDQLITKTTKWYDIKDLHEHEEVNHVIYYLVDDNKKEIYIGSATRLGDRVKPNRHEIPGWNKFRYEIVSPEYHDFLRMIEYHSIMNFATFFKNSGNLTSLKLSEYTLVNKDYKYYQK